MLPGIKVDQASCRIRKQYVSTEVILDGQKRGKTCISAGCLSCDSGGKHQLRGVLCFRQGLVPLEGCEGESSTRGLDMLEGECKSYRQQGARFCKWRAALRIGNGTPSQKAIDINAQQLAQYAAIAQVCTAFVLLLLRLLELYWAKLQGSPLLGSFSAL